MGPRTRHHTIYMWRSKELLRQRNEAAITAEERQASRLTIMGRGFAITEPCGSGHIELFRLPTLKEVSRRTAPLEIYKRPHWVQATHARFKITTGAHTDVDGTIYDVLLLQSVRVHPAEQRIGLGTEIVRVLARKYPDVLIAPSNPNENAQAWHQHLDTRFPSRMITVDDHRVTPGQKLDPTELA